MKTIFIKLVLAALALIAVEGAKANRVYEYDLSSPGNNTAIDQGAEVTVAAGSDNYTMHKLGWSGSDFDGWFAYGVRISNKSSDTGYTFKNWSSSNDYGLQVQYSGRGFAVLGLKSGYKVTFTINKESFSFVGTQPLTKNGVSLGANAAVETGVEYTVSTEAESVDILMQSGANYAQMYKVKIETTEPTIMTSIYNGDPIVFELPGEDYSSGSNYTTGGIKWTFGNTTWTRWNNTTGLTIDGITMNNRARGSAVASAGGTRYASASPKAVPDAGNYIVIDPSYSGTLKVYGEFKWTVYLVDENLNEQKTESFSSGSYAVPFSVEAGKKYYLFNENNKDAGFYGFTFTPTFGVEVGTTGYATFGNASQYNLQVPDGVTAYAATYNGVDDNVTLTPTGGIIKAGEGVIIKAAAGKYAFKTTANGWTFTGTNHLVAAPETSTLAQKTGDNTNYVLANDNGTAKFFAVDGSSSITAGKAYLSISRTASSASRSLNIIFADETTGIAHVNSEVKADGSYYSLSGQRVVSPGKGLYIKNGKKIIVK